MTSATNSNGSSHQKYQYQELPTQDQNERGLTKMADVIDDDDDNEHAQCGLGGLRCRCLQVFAHPNAYVICIGLLFMSSVGASGMYMSGVISTIEKQFQLKSSESGILMSMNDISSLCGVLFVTHFGGKSHRPRIVAFSGLVVALGTFVTALPQFILDKPSLEEAFVSGINQSEGTLAGYGKDLICDSDSAAIPCTAQEIEESGSQLGKTWPIMIGQLLCGVGGSAILPLSLSYVDDAVDKSILPIYLALMFLPMTISPLFAFSISGYCLSLHADFYKTDVSKLGLNPRDPEWLGAWWLGFIIYGCFLCLFSIPFFFFPRKMSKPKSYCCCRGMPECCKRMLTSGQGRRDQDRAAMAGITSQPENKVSGNFMAAMKDFLSSLWRLVTNPTFMTSLFGYCMLVVCFAGLGVFGAKYMQFQFGISPAKAGILLGFVAMPSSLIGIMLGGVLSSRMAGSHRGYTVLTIVAHSLCVLTYIITLFIGCDNADIAGVNAYYGSSNATTTQMDVYASCNTDCNCEKGIYSPVCGSDNVTYVTACFAGCQVLEEDPSAKTIYHDCSCIAPNDVTSPDEPTSGFAVHGACASECGLFLLYIVVLGISSITSSMSFNPSFMMKYRSVLDKDRDLSLGLSSLLSKILGFIPAPIIVGAAIETQCSYWQESCEATGECLMYDRPGLRLVYYGYATGTRFLAVVFYCLSGYFIFKNAYQMGPDEDDGENGAKTDEKYEMKKANGGKETDV